MLITNGAITRNIADEKLPEYKAIGYEAVKSASKPKAETGAAKKAVK